MEAGEFMIYQKPTKTITDTTYTTSDADNGHRIILSNASGIAVTLHTATGRYNFELEFDNVGAGDCTVGGQTLKQYTHAHVGNNGGSDWSVVVGGGSMSKAEIEAVLTGEITSHTHPAELQYEPLTNGDSESPEILFYNGDVIMTEV